jgi:hypothetical protein
LHSSGGPANNFLAVMIYTRPFPGLSNRLFTAVAMFLVFALGGGLEVLNNGRPFPARLLGTWQEEEETKGAKGREETKAASQALARRRSPRPPSPPPALRRHVLPDLVAADRTPATSPPLRSGAGQFQRC